MFVVHILCRRSPWRVSQRFGDDERVGLYLCVNGIGSVDTRGVGGRVYAALIQYMPSRLQLREKGYLLPVLTPSRRIRVHRQEICYLATSGQRWIGER